MRRQKCILHAEWETYFHNFSYIIQFISNTDDIPKSQGAGGVGEGLVEGLRDGGEASVALGVKKTWPSFHHTGSTLSKNQKGYVSCVSLQFLIPITSEDKAVFYIRGVPIHFR